MEHLRGAREQTEEWGEEHHDDRRHAEPHPRLDESQPWPVRLLAHVAIPDHEVLPEGEIAPERREGEAELAEIVEMVLADQRLGVQVAAPGQHEQREEG